MAVKQLLLLLFLVGAARAQSTGEFEIIGQVRIEIVSPFQLKAKPNSNPLAAFSFYNWQGSPDLHLSPQEEICTVEGNPGTHSVSLLRHTVFYDATRTPPIWKDTTVFRKEFVIAGGPDKPGKPDEPDEPDTPDPPSSDLTEYIRITQSAMSSLNDPVTSKKLGDTLEDWVKMASSSDSLSSLKAEVKELVGEVLLFRGNNKPWKEEWRVPMNEAMVSISSSKEYIAVIKAVAQTFLNKVSSNTTRGPPPKIVIKMLTNPSCIPCEKWKREVMPKLIGIGVTVLLKDVPFSPAQPLPYFQIETLNGSHIHSGYLTLQQFHNILRDKL